MLKRMIQLVYVQALQGRTKFSGIIAHKFIRPIVKFFGPQVHRYKGLSLLLTPISYIDKQIISGLGHDDFLFEAIDKKIKTRDDTFVDIGANFGLFSLYASKKGTVYSFEPSVRELGLLYRNLELNGINSVTVFPIALSNKAEILKLSDGQNGNQGGNSLVQEGNYLHDCICRKFDSIFHQEMYKNIRLVKINVEGFEGSVIAGMKAFLSSKFCTDIEIWVELTPSLLEQQGYSLKYIYDLFSANGFKSKFGLKESFQYDECFYK